MGSGKKLGGAKKERRAARRRGTDAMNAIAWSAFAIAVMSGTFSVYNRIDLGMAQSNAATVMATFSSKRIIQNSFEEKNCDQQVLDILSGTGAAFENKTLPRGYTIDPGNVLISDQREVLHVPFGGVAEYSVLGVASESAIRSGSFCRDARLTDASPAYRPSPLVQQAALLMGTSPSALITSAGSAEMSVFRGPYRPEPFLSPVLTGYAQSPDESVFGKLLINKGNSGAAAQAAGNGKGNGKGNTGNTGNGNAGNGNSGNSSSGGTSGTSTGNNGIGNGGANTGTSPGNSGGNAHCPKDPHHDHGPGGHDNGIGNDLCGAGSTPTPTPTPAPQTPTPPTTTPPVEPVTPVTPPPAEPQPEAPTPPVPADEPEEPPVPVPDEPETPADPTPEPEEPADPAPEEPVVPSTPEEPDAPTDPQPEPSTPAVPVSPVDPEPADPVEPAPPQEPEAPQEPAPPEEEPTVPDTPEQPPVVEETENDAETYPGHLTDIPVGHIAHTVTVYWNNDSAKAKSLCRYMASLDHGDAYVGHGPMGNNYIVRGESCDSEVPELTVVYQ